MGVSQQLHSHHLFASSWGLRSVGVFAPAFLSSDGEGADALLEGFLDGFEEGLAAEGTSSGGGGAEGLVAGVVVEACLEGGAPLVRGDGVFPRGGVEDGVGFCEAAVGGGAGPGVVPGVGGYAGADGVELDIGEGVVGGGGVEGAGVEAVLPEVAAAAVEAVDALCVEEVDAADGAGEGGFGPGHGDEVDVVGHEAVAEDAQSEARGLAVEQAEPFAAVVVGEEDVLPVVAALGDVVRDAGDDGSCASGHGFMIAEGVWECNRV